MKKIISILLCSVILLASTVQIAMADDVVVEDTKLEGQIYDTAGDGNTILGIQVVPNGFDWMDIDVLVLQDIDSFTTVPVEGVRIDFIEEGLIYKDDTVRNVVKNNKSSNKMSGMTNKKGSFNKPMKMHHGYYTIIASKDGYHEIVARKTKLQYHSTIKINIKEDKGNTVIPPPIDGGGEEIIPPEIIPSPGPIPGGGESGTIGGQYPNDGTGTILLPDETGSKEVIIKPIPPLSGGNGKPGIIEDVDVPLSGWNKFWSNIFDGQTPLFSFQGECILHWFLLVLLLVLTVLAALDLLSYKKRIEEMRNLNEQKKIR